MKFDNQEDFVQKTQGSIVLRCHAKEGKEEIVYSKGASCINFEGKDCQPNIKSWSYYAPVLGYLQLQDNPIPIWTSRNPIRKIILGVNENNLITNPPGLFNKYDLVYIMQSLQRCYKEEWLETPLGFVTKNYFWNAKAGVLSYMGGVVAKTKNFDLVFNSESEMLFHQNIIRSRIMLNFTYNQLPSMENYQEDFDV